MSYHSESGTGTPEPNFTKPCNGCGPTVNRSGAVRRVVQIFETDSRLTALCSDGSIWVTYNDSKWHDITPPPGCDHVEAP